MATGDDELTHTWAVLMGLFMSRREVLFARLGALQLTPPHGVVLMHLLHGGPTRMRDIADHMACDASYVTTVADRLEQLGLVERRASPDDRRVKALVLTEQGHDVARQLHEVFSEPPAALVALPEHDREALARIVAQLGDASPADLSPTRALR